MNLLWHKRLTQFLIFEHLLLEPLIKIGIQFKNEYQ